MKRTTTREKWTNIIRYINSVKDCKDGKSEKEQAELESALFTWLERNYQVQWNQKTLKELRRVNKIYKRITN